MTTLVISCLIFILKRLAEYDFVTQKEIEEWEWKFKFQGDLDNSR